MGILFQSLKNNKVSTLGFVLLFVSLVSLDQSTKFHAEKSFLTWSHPTDSRSYQSDSKLVKSWRSLPKENDNLANVDPLKSAGHWLDFNITYVRNHGAAWGFLSNAPDFVRLWGFYLLTVFVSCYLLYSFLTTEPQNRFLRIAYIFILAGACGNFIDRVVLKYVIDWLHFHWLIFGWEYSFPVFNGADIFINIGVILLLLFSSQKERSSPRV